MKEPETISDISDTSAIRDPFIPPRMEVRKILQEIKKLESIKQKDPSKKNVVDNKIKYLKSVLKAMKDGTPIPRESITRESGIERDVMDAAGYR